MKINKMKIRIEDAKGHVIIDKKLLNTPLMDHSVVALSIEHFDDPEPCMIHRSAVMKRMFSEMYDWLLPKIGQGKVSWESVPEHMRAWVNLQGESAASIKIY